MIEIIYRCNGEEFKEDDLIQVIKRDPFNEEKNYDCWKSNQIADKYGISIRYIK